MAYGMREKVLKAIVDAAYDGFAGEELRAIVIDRCPRTSESVLLNASLLALSDSDVTDPAVLKAIFDLAASGHKSGSKTVKDKV